MTRWPLCLAEIALYAVIAGLLIAFVLDARARWKELREDLDSEEPPGDAADGENGAEISTVRPRPGATPDDVDPPPLAS